MKILVAVDGSPGSVAARGALVGAVTSALVVRDEKGEPRYVIARATPTPAESD